MAVNFQRLLDVCKATELLPLGRWDFGIVCDADSEGCGTAGCMIGNYNAYASRPDFTFGNADYDQESDDWEYFGITESEYHWLFSFGPDCFELPTEYTDPRFVTRKKALARLRKFIYYKLRKNEFIVDEKLGVKESARCAEGNHGFCARAIQESKQAAELAGV